MIDEPTYYEHLRVSPHASTAEIRAAYRALAWQWHPDRSVQRRQSGESAEVIDVETDSRVVATRNMAQINAAYNVLRDPYRRAAYDAALREAFIDQQTVDLGDLATHFSHGTRARTSMLQMLRSDHAKRWILGTAAAASSLFVLMWAITMMTRNDSEVVNILAEDAALTPGSTDHHYPHVLDGEPLRLLPSFEVHWPTPIQVLR